MRPGTDGEIGPRVAHVGEFFSSRKPGDREAELVVCRLPLLDDVVAAARRCCMRYLQSPAAMNALQKNGCVLSPRSRRVLSTSRPAARTASAVLR